jgi:predicted phage terminase large subunit-like protein
MPTKKESTLLVKKIIEENMSKENTGNKYTAASNNFWQYCKLINPKFFKDSRPHLKEIADTLQAFYENRIIKLKPEDDWTILSDQELEDLICSGDPEVLVQYIVCFKLMMNLPPRHGKSYILTLYTQWMLGKDNENRVITVSYNETLATRFSASVRDGIDATKIDNKINIFSDVFPTTKIKYGDSSKQLWALEGQFFNYLGTGFGGTITGIGCRIGIIDDPIKNASEAFNERVLDEQYEWYTNTYLSRIEEGGKQIINMTRWSTKDLCGKVLEAEPDDWYVIKMKACLKEEDKKTGESGKMLCPELLSYKSYKDKTKPGKMSPEIAEANYQQQPMDSKGKLYTYFKTYTELPKDDKGRHLVEIIIAYADTADEGADKLCAIVADVWQGEGWVTDVYYSDKGMEVTEPETADMFVFNNVSLAKIESNNGGRGFARNVEKHIWQKYKTKKVKIEWFHQSENKISRILSNSTFVMEHIYFPFNWKERWPEFYRDMNSFQRAGKNKHDDAPDAVTGLAEMIQGKIKKKIKFGNKGILGLR